MLAALAAVALAAAYFATRPPDPETCFDRLGGPGPNSNTPRLDTYIDVPVSQWPALAELLRQFAAERGWLLNERRADSDPSYRAIDLCDQVTIVRADNLYMGRRQIGLGIIHMNYEGPANHAWQPAYRDLHRRLEARWPGRLRYVEGEFGRPIGRPAWLDQGNREPDGNKQRSAE